MSERLPFLNSCVGWPREEVQELIDLVDSGRPISRETFKRRTEPEDRRDLERSLGYRSGMKIEQDWHVRYFSGRLKGRRCYYMVHSAIEHVFAKAG